MLENRLRITYAMRKFDGIRRHQIQKRVTPLPAKLEQMTREKTGQEVFEPRRSQSQCGVGKKAENVGSDRNPIPHALDPAANRALAGRLLAVTVFHGPLYGSPDSIADSQGDRLENRGDRTVASPQLRRRYRLSRFTTEPDT